MGAGSGRCAGGGGLVTAAGSGRCAGGGALVSAGAATELCEDKRSGNGGRLPGVGASGVGGAGTVKVS